MARHFTKASSERVVFDITTGGMPNFLYGTVAAWVKRASASNGTQCILAFEDAGSNSPYSWFFNAANQLGAYNSSAGVEVDSTTTVTSTSEWTFVAWTKDTGNVTGRAHIYKPSAGWPPVHENMSGTQADAGGTPITIQVGGDNNGDYFDGDIAAVCAIRNRALSDSEVNRLASGFDLWVAAHDFLVEFKSGRDPFVTTTQARHPDQSPARTRQTASATTTGTTRSATADPPGYRFSRLTRRR